MISGICLARRTEETIVQLRCSIGFPSDGSQSQHEISWIFLNTIHKQASRCNLGGQLEIHLLDRIIARVNHPEIQKKPLLKQDLPFDEAWVMCEQSGDISDATAEQSVVHFQRTQSHPSDNPHRRNQKLLVKKISEQKTKPVNRRFSCTQFHLSSTHQFRNAGHSRKVCCQSKCSVMSAKSEVARVVSCVLTLKLSTEFSQILYWTTEFQGVRSRMLGQGRWIPQDVHSVLFIDAYWENDMYRDTQMDLWSAYNSGSCVSCILLWRLLLFALAQPTSAVLSFTSYINEISISIILKKGTAAIKGLPNGFERATFTSKHHALIRLTITDQPQVT